MELNNKRKDASELTKKLNKDVFKNVDRKYIDEEDEDIKEFNKHVILKLEDSSVFGRNPEYQKKINKQRTYSEELRPDTVNPYLWKYTVDLNNTGVVKVSDGMYAVVGFESAPVIFVRSQNGWIVQEAGNSTEGALNAMRLVEEAIHENIQGKIKAVIYSHNHPDHYGGIGAFGDDGDFGKAEEGKIPIYAPAGFAEHLIDENLYAGIPMNRRIQYQIGFLLPRDEKGWVSSGLHLGFESVNSTRKTILPTEAVEKDKTIDIDGVKVSFVLTPDTETVTQMCTYFHDHKTLYLGDNGIGVIHNVYTMRGTPVRNSNFWGKIFYHMSLLFGDEVEAVIPGHGLIHFRHPSRPDSANKYLLNTAAAYKYTHDQALLFVNQGYSMNEIGNSFRVPESIARTWYTRGIYGCYSFNARAVYQKYSGFYDGNPANLAPLPEYELAKKIIEYSGGPEEALKKAYADFQKGEYRWTAVIANHIVSADPKNLEARYLFADALEQLGYAEENSLRRNAYLSGALELREPGANKKIRLTPMNNNEVIPYVSSELILDYLGINFDGFKAHEKDICFTLKVIDNEQTEYHYVHIYRGTILHEKTDKSDNSEAITLTKSELYDLSVKKYTGKNAILKEIQEYVTDTSEYNNFNLIEPIDQLRNI